MYDLITRTRWDQAQDFLESGDPPMYIQLLALNGFFVVLFLIRRAWIAKPLPANTLLGVQILLLVANVLVMLQLDITQTISRLI
ncbi:MAG: hypothetical protein U1F47_13410 [Hyphomicrobiales bacterium]